MAGKKNFQESVSKSARVGKKKDESFQASSDMKRIISLAGGTHAYILDPRDGRTHRLQVGSDRWQVLMGDLLNDVHHGMKIQGELNELSWVFVRPDEETLATDLVPGT